MIDLLEVNGTQPNIEGQVYEELFAEEYWHHSQKVSPANVIHLRFAGSWHRLYFDCGIIFWRESQEAPVPYDMPELESEVRIIDLGAYYSVRSAQLERIESKAIEGGSEVALHFSGGKTVRFRDIHDVTTHDA